MIANVKSKIIVSRQHFFDNMIFSATSKVQNYQNKTREKPLYPNKYILITYISRDFNDILFSNIHALLFIFSKL